MRDLDELFDALQQSTFRARFSLRNREQEYLQSHAFDEILEHARQFVQQRLAPAEPVNDGRQTPMRGHPVFVAQHATATCCRNCLQKWHAVPHGHALSHDQIDYVVRVLAIWLRRQSCGPKSRPCKTSDQQLRLFDDDVPG